MKVLRVGDPHAKPGNLVEMTKLMEFVLETGKKHAVDRVELLGDLFHTHAVIRLEVLEFWDKWINILASNFELIVLVGNHDMSGDYGSDSHALSVFKHVVHNVYINCHIVDKPTQIGVLAYVPYIHDNQRFIDLANGLADSGAKTLVSHKTFVGSKFESGIYAPDGVDPDALRYDTIISGHIHGRQRFGKVIYPGTSRWDTNSDANEQKGIWIVLHDDITGKILEEEFVDTSHVCEPIYSIEWKEGTEQPPIPAGRITLELIGTSAWITQQKANLKGKVGLKSTITDKAKPKTRQAGKNLYDFINSLFVTTVNRDDLLKYMKELELV